MVKSRNYSCYVFLRSLSFPLPFPHLTSPLLSSPLLSYPLLSSLPYFFFFSTTDIPRWTGDFFWYFGVVVGVLTAGMPSTPPKSPSSFPSILQYPFSTLLSLTLSLPFPSPFSPPSPPLPLPPFHQSFIFSKLLPIFVLSPKNFAILCAQIFFLFPFSLALSFLCLFLLL